MTKNKYRNNGNNFMKRKFILKSMKRWNYISNYQSKVFMVMLFYITLLKISVVIPLTCFLFFSYYQVIFI